MFVLAAYCLGYISKEKKGHVFWYRGGFPKKKLPWRVTYWLFYLVILSI